VSDNASTDPTPDVVRSYGERVRYHRNAENIGMWPNLVRLTEFASGEYFSWLQDDDVIHRDFVRRASEAFARSDDIVFYASYAIYSRSSKSIKRWDTIHGPVSKNNSP
jgi:glycosyltransferase involved in cell wall biosynthesis